MKIRFKIKHLITSVLIILILIFGLLPAAVLWSSGKLIDHNRVESAQMLYESYLRIPLLPYKEQFQYHLVMTKLPAMERVNMYRDGSQNYGSKPLTQQEVSELRTMLEELTFHARNRKIRMESYGVLMETCLYTMDIQALKRWIDWGSRQSDEFVYLSEMYAAYLEIANRQQESAYERLQKYKDRDWLDARYEYLAQLLSLYLPQKKIEREEPVSYGKAFLSFVTPVEKGQQRRSERKEGWIQLSGRITCDGEPMPFVHIVLNPHENEFSSIGYFPVAITDEQGYYETVPFQDGGYNVGLAVPAGVLYDKILKGSMKEGYTFIGENRKIDFEFARIFQIHPLPMRTIQGNEDLKLCWEKVEEADYYQVRSGVLSDEGSITFNIQNREGEYEIRGETYTLNLEEYNKEIRSYIWDEQGPAPENILGAFLPGRDILFMVDAYNRKGEKISSTQPIVSDWNKALKLRYEGELSKGQRLFIERRYKEAEQYYEKVLKQNPKDRQALQYLMRYYSEEVPDMVNYYEGRRDVKRALDLLERYSQEEGNEKAIMDLLDRLSGEELNEYQGQVESLFRRLGDSIDVDAEMNLRGRMALADGNLEQAYRFYERQKSMDRAYFLMLCDLQQGNNVKALERLKSIDDASLCCITQHELLQTLQNFAMAQSKGEDEKLRLFLGEYLLGKDDKEDEIKLRKFYSTLTEEPVKQMLWMIAKEEYIDLDLAEQ